MGNGHKPCVSRPALALIILLFKKVAEVEAAVAVSDDMNLRGDNCNLTNLDLAMKQRKQIVVQPCSLTGDKWPVSLFTHDF